MNGNIRCLLKACDQLGLSHVSPHPTGNCVLVDGRHLFVNWATPLISLSLGRLMLDKDFTWHLLKGAIAMPESHGYLSPEVESRFQQYVQLHSIAEIAADVERRLAYPLILKRNSGSHGSHVFLCRARNAVHNALSVIFNERDKDWDYLALAQQYIDAQAEYRIVALQRRIAFAYRKDTGGASFTGNLSPLHWDGAKAVRIEDEALLERLARFIAPIFERLPVEFCGIDVILDRSDRLWLIELNGSPSFEIFIRDNGEEQVVAFYRKVLGLLTASSHTNFGEQLPLSRKL